MRIVILGAGDTGRLLAEKLSRKRHSITVIDESETHIAAVGDTLDVGAVCGSGAEATVLAEASVADAELFIGLTNSEHVNLLGASVAKAMGAAKTIARVDIPIQTSQWLFDYQSHFGIDYIFSSERLTANEVSKYFLNPGESAIEQIGRGRISVKQVQIAPESKLLGTPLKELSLPRKVRIAVIRRGNHTLIPAGDDALEANDQVILFGEQDKVEELTRACKAPARGPRTTKITIYGGSDFGYALAQVANRQSVNLRIIEADPLLCSKLSKDFPNAAVVHGDGRSPELLEEEQIEKADFFVGASMNDEDNIMACLQAQLMGVKKVLPILHRAENSAVIEKNLLRLGFLAAVSPRQAGLLDLIRFVESDDFFSVGHLSNDVELVQITVHQNARTAGRLVNTISWPKGSSLVAFLRNDEVLVPDGSAKIIAGDSVYAVVLPEARKHLLKLLIS